MSNGLDTDQDKHNVSPDQGPNCLQRLSAYDKSRRLCGHCLLLLCLFHVPPTAKVIWRRGLGLKSHPTVW